MRILTVGCHDAFVESWVADHWTGEGLHIDGVELNPRAVTTAARRFAERDVTGLVVQCSLNDAFEYFEFGTYDAVVAFEVIEHVSDVEDFLNGLEAFCAPGGRVYLSTPDGVFGDGNNPHHLRTFRSIDLLELIRRRGEVHDAMTGRDGLVCASYTPDTFESNTLPIKALEVAIYCGGGWEEWSPFNIENGGLGGSETAAIRLAGALNKMGYTVTVYGEVTQGVWGGVSFRHHTAFDPTQRRYLTIVSRQPHMLDRWINSAKTVFWAHDTDYGDQITPERIKNLDAYFVLSEWHYNHTGFKYPFLLSSWKIKTINNGIYPSFFVDARYQEKKNRVIYSSSPDRGLDLVLENWPAVREQVPDAELIYAYAPVYDKIADVHPPTRQFRERIAGLADCLPGVVNLGALGQDNLATAMARSKVWIAPSYNTPSKSQFNETFCIGAVEAAAARCYRIGGGWGALVERDLDWYLNVDHDGRPEGESMVTGMVRGLTLDRPTNYIDAQQARALEMDWTAVARSMLDCV